MPRFSDAHLHCVPEKNDTDLARYKCDVGAYIAPFNGPHVTARYKLSVYYYHYDYYRPSLNTYQLSLIDPRDGVVL